MVTVKCKLCGDSFEAKSKRYKYCKGTGCLVDRKCIVCGEGFKWQREGGTKSAPIYCSKSCFSDSNFKSSQDYEKRMDNRKIERKEHYENMSYTDLRRHMTKRKNLI